MSDGEINANEHPHIPRVVAVEPREGYLLWVAFEDGAKGLLDMTQDVQGKSRAMQALRDLDTFRSAYVNGEEEEGLIWPVASKTLPYYGPWDHGALYYRVVLNGGLPTDKSIPFYEINKRVRKALASEAAVGA